MIVSSKRLNCSFCFIDGTLTGTITPVQSGPEKNGNEWVLYIPQIPRRGTHHQMYFYVIPRTPNGFKVNRFQVLLCYTNNSIQY